MKLFYPTILPGDVALADHEATAAAFRRGRAERSELAVRRAVRAERDRRYRRRKARALAVAPVEFDGTVINFLLRTRWLDESEAGDKQRIGEAIAALIKDAMRR